MATDRKTLEAAARGVAVMVHSHNGPKTKLARELLVAEVQARADWAEAEGLDGEARRPASSSPCGWACCSVPGLGGERALRRVHRGVRGRWRPDAVEGLRPAASLRPSEPACGRGLRDGEAPAGGRPAGTGRLPGAEGRPPHSCAGTASLATTTGRRSNAVTRKSRVSTRRGRTSQRVASPASRRGDLGMASGMASSYAVAVRRAASYARRLRRSTRWRVEDLRCRARANRSRGQRSWRCRPSSSGRGASGTLPGLAPLIFEFGSLPKGVFPTPGDFYERLGPFLGKLPSGHRYSIEIRNAEYLTPEYFELLKSHNVAHVFNSWTRMPALEEQIQLPGAFSADFTVVARIAQGRPDVPGGGRYVSALRSHPGSQRAAREALADIARRPSIGNTRRTSSLTTDSRGSRRDDRGGR